MGTYAYAIVVGTLFLGLVKAQDDIAISLAQAWVDGAPSGLELDQSSALVTFYYATHGVGWINSQDWLSHAVGDCQWYNQADPACDGTKLIGLILKENNLAGIIPSTISALSDLQELDLDENKVGGSMPTTFGLMSNLVEINLRHNQIVGPLITELVDLPNLERIFLHENLITGTLPTQYGLMTNLEDMEISTNLLKGTIPKSFQNLVSLEYFELYDNKKLNGTIPANMFSLPKMEQFGVEYNWFTGTIPTTVGLSTSLKTLNLKDNYFSGPIPTQLGKVATLREIRMDDNRFTGTIPTTLGLLINLEELHLDQNEEIVGTIPTQLGNCASLQELVLAETGITGTIPTELSQLVNLTRLDVNVTALVGTIPLSLCSLSELVFTCAPGAGLCGCSCPCQVELPAQPASAPAPKPAPKPKPENVGGGGGGGTSICFSAENTVVVYGRSEPVQMRDLQVGDSILTSTGQYSRVYAFGHYHSTRYTDFIEIKTDNGRDRPLQITADHLVYLSEQRHPVRADSLRVGDVLESVNGPRTISGLKRIQKTGVYAPLTNQGTLVVNGIVASSYVSVKKGHNKFVMGLSFHDLIHVTVAPFRFLCNMVPSIAFGYSYNGMPHYVYFGLGVLQWIKGEHWLLQCILMTGILTATGLVYALEMALSPTPALVAITALVVHQLWHRRNKKKGT